MKNRLLESIKLDSKVVDSSIEKKLEILKLNEGDASRLKNMECKVVNINSEEGGECIEINLKDLSGVNRVTASGVTNWFECLDAIHKMYIFDRFKGKENFNELLNDKALIRESGIPVVVEQNGKYYIDSDGMHRLTIGKCIGIETALVKVKK